MDSHCLAPTGAERMINGATCTGHALDSGPITESRKALKALRLVAGTHLINKAFTWLVCEKQKPCSSDGKFCLVLYLGSNPGLLTN